MAWDVDGYEVLQYFSALVMAALAVLLLRANRIRAQNRWFVAVLVVEMVLAAASPSMAITTDMDRARQAATVLVIGLSFVAPIYLGFLSTLDTPISRALRKPFLRVLPWALPASALLALPFDLSLLVGRPDPMALDWGDVGGPLLPFYQATYIIAAVLGLLTTFLYWRTSPHGTPQRRQGFVFALGFGLHDAGMIIAIATGIASGGLATSRELLLFNIANHTIPIMKLLLVSFVTYGILRLQLFDIDLKVKWTLGRGTALALLTATFFVATETIEFFLPAEGLMANLVGAGIVAILARPAWAFGTRFANTLLPGVVETEEFRRGRRLEVYRASLESVAADGLITQRERRILDTMRAKLEISAADAERIESELLQRGASRPDAMGAGSTST